MDQEPIQFGPDVDDVVTKRETAKVACLPAMRIRSGPLYVHKGVFYAVSKVYSDGQLAFVQATGLSAETYGYVESLIPTTQMPEMSNISLRVRSLIQRRLEMRIEVMESLCLRDRIMRSHLLQLHEIIDSSKSKPVRSSHQDINLKIDTYY